MMMFRRLDEVATIFNGKTPSKSEQRGIGHPVLKIKDVSEIGCFKGLFESFVEIDLADKHMARWIKTGDSLILNAAHNADYVASKTFFAGEDVQGALPTGEWLLVRPNEAVALPGYVNYWLRSAVAKKAIKFLVRGIHLYPKDVGGLSIPVPPLDEQCRIVDLLSRAEGIVRLRRETQKKAAEVIPALFLDMFGDPATNPKGWELKRLAAHAFIPSVVRTPNLVNEADYLCIGADSIESNTGAFLACPTVREIIPRSGKYWFEKGDVLYSKIRPYLAKVALAMTNGYCSADMYPLRCRETMHARFLLSLLLTKAFTDFATAASVRAQMPKLNRETLFAYCFPLPPLALQLRFAELADQNQSLLEQQIIATDLSQKTFHALLSSVFSGGETGSKAESDSTALG